MNELTHLSLFSGIGGIDLAAKAAGFETVCQCEWADYPTAVLEKRWPHVPRFRDITTLTKEAFFEKTGRKTITLISGGFPASPFQAQDGRKGLPIRGISGRKWQELFPNSSPIGCLGRMLPGLSIWGSTRRCLTWSAQATLFKHSYIRLAASARGMSAQELLSSRLMFPTPLASDDRNVKDAMNMNVYLSDNGIWRKKNPNGARWSLPLSAAVFYLTPVASDGFRSTLKPETMKQSKEGSSLAAQVISRKPGIGHGSPQPDWVDG